METACYSCGTEKGYRNFLTKKEKAERLSRIRQNISLCRKAKVSIKILFSKKVREAKSLLLTLGASTKQTKEAIDF